MFEVHAANASAYASGEAKEEQGTAAAPPAQPSPRQARVQADIRMRGIWRKVEQRNGIAACKVKGGLTFADVILDDQLGQQRDDRANVGVISKLARRPRG